MKKKKGKGEWQGLRKGGRSEKIIKMEGVDWGMDKGQVKGRREKRKRYEETLCVYLRRKGGDTEGM